MYTLITLLFSYFVIGQATILKSNATNDSSLCQIPDHFLKCMENATGCISKRKTSYMGNVTIIGDGVLRTTLSILCPQYSTNPITGKSNLRVECVEGVWVDEMHLQSTFEKPAYQRLYMCRTGEPCTNKNDELTERGFETPVYRMKIRRQSHMDTEPRTVTLSDQNSKYASGTILSVVCKEKLATFNATKESSLEATCIFGQWNIVDKEPNRTVYKNTGTNLSKLICSK